MAAPSDGRHPEVATWVVRADKAVRYEVRMCRGLLDPVDTDLAEAGGSDAAGRRRFVVIDATVDRFFGDRIRAYFDWHNFDCTYHVVPAREHVKDLETATGIVRALDGFRIARRREPVIAIGGGVLLDLVGLVCSLYRRGTPFVRVPTTLIGIVDAGVGVKTGVNFNGNKNRLGTYFPADLTLLDRSFLATLGERHISNGLAEILKMALIRDGELFDVLEASGTHLLADRFQGQTSVSDRSADRVLQLAIDGMLRELQPNLWEQTLERSVDYGHTFSPTIEMRAMPELLHGEAVALDMAFTTVLAAHRGLVTAEQQDRIFALMRNLGLPTWHPLLTAEVLTEALEDATRHRDGRQRFPIPIGIGDVAFVDDVTVAEIEKAAAVLPGIATTAAESR
ncbi:sedoheptulose 7-phosphate cyclase [Dactylosporangium roseum]|uniref:2-epi-5-epi-valiolone synthase n=1 Tax=Dactylosporangium roseum TaxID=47989 RepID=A0ABY5YYI0_9ACTN|nr:sedoheptulose 7-phosphate cyclase [Dactylosporangium roseum]UWZ34809.1 sedoheptulose 7-phosphate cyclase [Dactylosporangium roseum]